MGSVRRVLQVALARLGHVARRSSRQVDVLDEYVESMQRVRCASGERRRNARSCSCSCARENSKRKEENKIYYKAKKAKGESSRETSGETSGASEKTNPRKKNMGAVRRVRQVAGGAPRRESPRQVDVLDEHVGQVAGVLLGAVCRRVVPATEKGESSGRRNERKDTAAAAQSVQKAVADG